MSNRIHNHCGCCCCCRYHSNLVKTIATTQVSCRHAIDKLIFHQIVVLESILSIGFIISISFSWFHSNNRMLKSSFHSSFIDLDSFHHATYLSMNIRNADNCLHLQFYQLKWETTRSLQLQWNSKSIKFRAMKRELAKKSAPTHKIN